MSFEVEVKYRLSGDSELAARLAEHGIESAPEVVYEDTYLEHPARKLARSNEAFRIRRAGDLFRVTHKGPRRRGPIKTRRRSNFPWAMALGPLNAASDCLATLVFARS